MKMLGAKDLSELGPRFVSFLTPLPYPHPFIHVTV